MRGIANKRGRRAVGAQMLKTRRSVSLQFAALALLSFLLACCATPKDLQHHVIISVKDQKLALLDRETLVAIFPVSTSKCGLGDWPSSRCTPLGELEIAEKIGDNAPLGTVFKDRRRTGEIVLPNAPGRDTYIHGTPEERNLGLPVSYGCVRMKSEDVIKLYDVVGIGAQVSIVDTPLATVVPGLASETHIASTNDGGMVAAPS